MNPVSRFFCFAFLCLICLPALTACNGVRETIGLNKEAPDEFSVVRRAPLEIPPGLTAAALPPPRPGMARPQETAPSEDARVALTGTKSGVYAQEASESEDVLLQKTNAAQADPSIRRTLDKESEELKDVNKPVIQKLTGLAKGKTENSATVVDAQKEFERLKKNKEEGKPANEGDTPYIDE